jgi:hypothetical protein
MCLSPQNSYTLYILVERHNTIQPTIIRNRRHMVAQATHGGPGDTWWPRSCPTPVGGCWSPGDTWRLRSCPEPGGGYHSTDPSSAPFRGRSGCGTVPIRPSLHLPGLHPTRVAALPPPSTTSTTTTTSTSKDYHLHVVLASLCSSHSIHAITTLQLRGKSIHRILPLTYSSVSPSVVLPL